MRRATPVLSTSRTSIPTRATSKWGVASLGTMQQLTNSIVSRTSDWASSNNVDNLARNPPLDRTLRWAPALTLTRVPLLPLLRTTQRHLLAPTRIVTARPAALAARLTPLVDRSNLSRNASRKSPSLGKTTARAECELRSRWRAGLTCSVCILICHDADSLVTCTLCAISF